MINLFVIATQSNFNRQRVLPVSHLEACTAKDLLRLLVFYQNNNRIGIVNPILPVGSYFGDAKDFQKFLMPYYKLFTCNWIVRCTEGTYLHHNKLTSLRCILLNDLIKIDKYSS